MAEPDFLQRKKSGPCVHALNLFSFRSIVSNYQIYLFMFGSLFPVFVLTFRGPFISSSFHGHYAVVPSIGPLQFSLHESCLQLYSSHAQSFSEVAPSDIFLASHSVCCPSRPIISYVVTSSGTVAVSVSACIRNFAPRATSWSRLYLWQLHPNF